MDKYIIVTTFCNKKEIANKIIDVLFRKKACSWKSII